MKDKILLFVIGVLVGAVVATGAFYIYSLSSNKCNNNTQMPSGEPPEMPSGFSKNMQPPEMQNGNSSQEYNFN